MMKEKSTIALVDDERNILTSLRMALEAEGYKVRTYNDGASALEALSEDPADLGIFDIKMPRMDGMELLRRVRQQSDMPVIFLTSKDEEIDELFGLKMGADDYVSKPFSGDELVSRVKAVLRRSGNPAAPSLPAGVAAGGGAKISDAEFIAALENAPPPPAARKSAPGGAPVSAPIAAGSAPMASNALPILAELQRRLYA